jgi:hypothetical protein
MFDGEPLQPTGNRISSTIHPFIHEGEDKGIRNP